MDGYEKEIDREAVIALVLELREEIVRLHRRIAVQERQHPPHQPYSVEAAEQLQPAGPREYFFLLDSRGACP